LILEQMRELIDDAVGDGQVACSEVTAALVKRSGKFSFDLKKLRPYSGSKSVTLFFVNYVPTKSEGAKTNLPLLTNRFFGRSEELRQLKQFFLKEKAQLVTLVGFGGCGKTRLALEFGSQVLEDYNGAVCFVSLQNLKEPEKIGEALAKALGLKVAPDKEPLEIALQVLAGQRYLLILDNFEQLMPEGAETLREVMVRLPKAQFLVTSRCPLGLPQERVMPLQPLPFPKVSSRDGDLLEALKQFPSVQMFVDRAKSVQPDFQLTERTASKVSKICELLEGIPLSIELTASSLSYMSLSQILKRLSNRLEFLKSRQRNIPAKHRCMKEVLRATYELLSPELRYALTYMSVFRGGATIDALQAVSGTNDISDAILQLRNFGLVQTVNPKGDEQRFVLLETLREFVDKITDTEVKHDLRHRHTMFFLSLSERFSESEGRSSDEWEKWLDRVEFERDNLRAALEWAIENKPQVALQIMDSLTMFWTLKGSFREARQWAQRILNRIPADQPELMGKALTLAGYWSIRVGDYKLAQKLCQSALSLYEQTSNRSGQGKANFLLAQIAFLEGNYDVSRKHFETSLSIYQSENDIKGQADVYLSLGTIAFRQGDLQSSQQYYEKCLQLFEAIRDRLNAENAKVSLANIAWRQGNYERARTLYGEAIRFWEKVAPEKVAGILTDWGLIALSTGDYEQAKRHYEAALEIRRGMGDLVGVGAALNGLASVVWREGRFEDAQKLLTEALKIFRALRNQWCVALTLTDLGNLSLLKGNPQNACKLLSQSLRLWMNLGDRWGIANALRKLASALTRCGDLQNAILKLCESISLCEIVGDRLGIAEAMEAMAEALHQMGESALAVQFLSAAATLRDQIRAPLPKVRTESLSALLTTLRKNLGEVRFENAWREGQAANFHRLLRHLTYRHLLDSNLSMFKQSLRPQLRIIASTS
ncbi:MAG: tetratricopeptide repeat protein, partial [Armatimonadota bacterium]